MKTMSGLSSVIFVAVLASFLGGSGAVRIDLSPDRCIATTEDSIQISCVSDSDDDSAKEITVIEISRNNDMPIAFLRQCSNITLGTDATSRFQAEGRIEKGPEKSYLNLTLLNPRSEDTGIYTCVMYYLDPNGILQDEVASGNLKVEKLDVQNLEKVLNQMKNEITVLGKALKSQDATLGLGNRLSELETDTRNHSRQLTSLTDKDATLGNRLSELETDTRSHSRQLTGLTDKVNYRCAFSATNNNDIKTKAGQIIILPDMITREGIGYDESTGVFTAPRDGVYVFHLVIMEYTACDNDIDLKVNNVVVARLEAYDKPSKYEQSSISTVVHLKVGDRVYSLMEDSNCVLHNKRYTVFTGYLIKAV